SGTSRLESLSMRDYRAATVVGKTAIGRLPAAGKIMRCSMRWGGTLRGERIEWMTPNSRHVTGRCPELIVDCATMSCQKRPRQPKRVRHDVRQPHETACEDQGQNRTAEASQGDPDQ